MQTDNINIMIPILSKFGTLEIITVLVIATLIWLLIRWINKILKKNTNK